MVFHEGSVLDNSFQFYRIVDNYYYILVEVSKFVGKLFFSYYTVH